MSHRVQRFALWLVAGVPMLGVALVTAAPQAPAPATAGAGAAKVNVEGCLTKEPGAEASTAAELFVLTVAAPEPRATGAPTGGAVPAPALPKMYVLRSAAEPAIAFARFVNQRVKVEGTSTDRATTAPLAGRSPEATPYPAPVATGSAGSGATATPFDRANLPTLAVRTVTTVAPTCR